LNLQHVIKLSSLLWV